MALIERLQRSPDATFWPGKIPMNYVYTAGRAGEEFYKALRDKGRFIGSRCEECDTVYVPPRIFCERCFERLEGKFVTVKSHGIVVSITECHETYDEKPKKPSLVAAIQLEGADTVIFHRLGEVDAEACYIGMPVVAVLEPKSKRTGSILDVKYFKPR